MTMDPLFRVDVIAATPNPQQCIYAAMHQDYSEDYVFYAAPIWPDETRAGEICVKRLLAGGRGHYGPLEHPQITLNVGWFPHSVMQQARTHRVGVSFDVQSMRYTGERICRAASGDLELEEVFYLRPVGDYADRQGKKYSYTAAQRGLDLEICRAAAERYRDMLLAGFAEEHARGILPFDVRQHFVVSFSLRALLHFLDLRAKADAQLEIRQLCDLMWPHLQAWAPEIAAWYEKARLHRARLAP
jgi:thymidylate synthase (FAD)